MFKRISELDLELWKGILKLYMNDPLTHIYLLYDLIYELNNIDVLFKVSGNEIVGYLFTWKGPKTISVHVWGEVKELINNIQCDGESIIVIYNRKLLEPVIRFLKVKGKVEVKEYLDMVVDEKSFKPFSVEKVIRLNVENEHHVEEFLKLLHVSGWKATKEIVKELLTKRRYYGIFKEGKLVSIACAFFRMPEVWPIGNVYTHPNYRNRGYAKTVTSAITKDALQAGARALLHVAKDNAPAIRVYKALGYKEIMRKPWVFFNP